MTDTEKGVKYEEAAPAYQHDGEPHLSEKARKQSIATEARHGEGREIIGDDFEKYGYVARGLKSRHIQFIALGGTIGTGLFLGIGGAFARAGPLSVLLGYSATGFAIFTMMQSLGEMATWYPVPGAIPQFAAKYVDPALGFAVGWNNWYNSAITLCAEISAASIVIGFWPGAANINVAAWIAIIIVVVVALNIFAVSIYGEAEFIFASIKILTILGLLILSFILFWGGGPSRDRLGFRYWKHPGAMKSYPPEVSNQNLGRFLGLFSTLINAAFSYGGVELVAVAAGEAENPRKNIPKAVRRVFWRILFFYVLGSLAIGVLVPSDDERLTNGGVGAAGSPWVIAMVRAGIPVLPSIINAVILTSASSSANAFLYTGARYLYALAQNRQAPAIFLKCSKTGVPIVAVGVTASISLLTFMCVSTGATTVFEWFLNLVTIASLFTWVTTCVSYLRFYKALAAQGVDRNTLVFKSHFQPFSAWFALIFFTMIIIFNGFAVFIHGRWAVTDFLVCYIGVPIFFGLFAFWKIFKRTKLIKPEEVDLFTGKEALDREEWPEQIPRNILEKFWYWLA